MKVLELVAHGKGNSDDEGNIILEKPESKIVLLVEQEWAQSSDKEAQIEWIITR